MSDDFFKTEYTKAADGSGELFQEEIVTANGEPVVCLGKTFANDAERRAYFTEELRKKLRDPEFRKIEGFPIGEDEDILALSDPPYYCACPNPWIGEFIQEWEREKPPKDDLFHYVREPFAANVSEGKNDPIYNAHSYHTKVPHKAIMRYILHYTEPGDIVFDGFCGTGMTGVAAQMCGDINQVRSLGYKVDEKTGDIFDPEAEDPSKPISKLGARKAILNDLSPAATFIAYNYNTPVDAEKFEREAKRILAEVEAECGWMYETQHVDKNGKPIRDGEHHSVIGKNNYTVWSQIFTCPHCLQELDYFHAAFEIKNGQWVYNENFKCPHCHSLCAKSPSKKSGASRLNIVMENVVDELSGEIIRRIKYIPVLINYSVSTHRFVKPLDGNDRDVLAKIEIRPDKWIPNTRMPEGDESRRNDVLGITNVNHFYQKRTLSILQAYKSKSKSRQCEFLLGSILPKMTIMNRYMPQHGGRALVGPMANTLYVPPVYVENNVLDQLEFQLKKLVQAFSGKNKYVLSTLGLQTINIADNSIDYIFLDPPFGANIMYSELSFLREAWLKIFTNNGPEAIENETQKKGIGEYRSLMEVCFRKAHSLLKPGRWMTVEFSNTSSAVWNSLQTALTNAGFIVANVSVLDKTRGGLHAMIGPTAVKMDLVISAYKPNGGFEDRFIQEAESESGVWDFIRTHLKYLPVAKIKDGKLMTIVERDPRLLFDQLVAYYVRKGYNVPISSQDFQTGLAERFDERDGLYYLPEQAAEYDKKKAMAKEFVTGDLFVSDEASAIAWLRKLLKARTLTFQEINPLFMQELSAWNKYEKTLELSQLLEENFLMYDGKGEVPSQIHTYLSTNWHDFRDLAKDDPKLVAKAENRWYVPDPNKASDLEKIRDKSLLREFEEYRNATKKLKTFRLEAVRAGFKHAYQERDYATILAVGKKIPEDVLEEDEKLLMWFNQAEMRVEE